MCVSLSFSSGSESFDLVLLCSYISVWCKARGRKDVKMQKQGNKVKWMAVSGIKMAEIRTLCEYYYYYDYAHTRALVSTAPPPPTSGAPGTSLSSLGESAGVGRAKGIFPFDKLRHPSYLEERRLPARAEDWASQLDPTKAPTQEEVDRANELFDAHGMTSTGAFLDHYLDADVQILQKAIISLHAAYYQLLSLSFIESRRSTASSFSTCAAQTYLTRNRRPGQLVCNHQRVFSLMTQMGLRGGLTQISRKVMSTC